ncbi:MAG: DNA polymerase III subunit delta [Bacteroidaceae bacterium]|nr:DNA polymerase III subunit delta [Bacteroidaceae bacterium]
MTFDQIIGQETAKERLLTEYEQGKVPHALMLTGPEGCGALPLAIAFAQKLLGGGTMAEQLKHPDLHFAFPIYKKYGSAKPTYCDDFISEWRELCLSQPYFGMAEWMAACGADNQQLIIYGDESDAITRKLSMKSSQGGYKVVVLWLAEKMNETCANKLLKLLEEPPQQTVFLLVSEQPEKVLQTIRSRTQIIELTPLKQRTIEHADTAMFFELFVMLMRLSYARKVKEMKQWADRLASLGRERQKSFFVYAQQMLRENFIYNFHHQAELNSMTEAEAQFAVKFAPFINERNVLGIMEELTLAQRDIEANVNAKIVFFDFALKMIVLIKSGK